MTRSGPSKQVKRYVNANKKELDDLKSQVGAVASEIGALRAKVEGGETVISCPSPDDKQLADIADALSKRAEPGKVIVLPNGARVVDPSPATIVSSGTATAEPVYVRSGWTRTVEMTPQGVAILHEEQQVNDDMPLEPTENTMPVRMSFAYKRHPIPSDPTTLATSPTPQLVPVRRFAMFGAIAKSVAVLGLLGFAAVGACATGGLVAFRMGYLEIEQLATGVVWLNEQSEWILSSAGLAGMFASVKTAWPFIRARAWSLLCSAVQQAVNNQQND